LFDFVSYHISSMTIPFHYLLFTNSERYCYMHKHTRWIQTSFLHTRNSGTP